MELEDVIKKTIEKEKALNELCDKLAIQLKDESPLSVSYLNEVFALLGLPEEKDMPKGMDWDPFINQYVAAIHGDREIDEVVKEWQKKISKMKAVKYQPKNHLKLLEKFLVQEQRLFSAVKLIGAAPSTSSVLGQMVNDWDLANALVPPPDIKKQNLYMQDLFAVVEQNGNVKKFLKTWA